MKGSFIFSSCYGRRSLAADHNDAMRENIKKQAMEGFVRRSIQSVRDTFESHKDRTKQVILASSLGQALSDLGVHAEPTEITELLKSWDLNNDGGLDFQEFSALVNMPSPIEEWVGGLSLNRLVADALPRGSCPIKDQLRHLSRTTPEQVKVSCEIIKEELLRVLQEKLDDLKKSFEKLDSQPEGESNSKFQIFKMNVGTVNDFHKGLSSRIGKRELLTLTDFFTINLMFPCK
jgi:Ca2+-binding EF-hand superfamily protein